MFRARKAKALGALKRPWLSRPQTPGTHLRTRPLAGDTLAGTKPSVKTVLYCRVSTVDQTLDHQRTQAQQSGFTPDLVLADHGVSGISTRLCERPEGRRLFDILRGGDTLVVRWVDRLGRNYEDVTDTVREFIRRGIRIETVINRMTFDGTTTDPMQQAIRDSLLAFMAAMSQAQAEVTKEAQKAGIAHAQANDDGTKYRGRKPTFTCEQFVRVRELLNQGIGLSAIAKTVGLKRQSVYRIRVRAGKADGCAPGVVSRGIPATVLRAKPCCLIALRAF